MAAKVLRANYLNILAEQLASLATQTLIDLLENDPQAVHQVLLTPELIIGQSTAPRAT